MSVAYPKSRPSATPGVGWWGTIENCCHNELSDKLSNMLHPIARHITRITSLGALTAALLGCGGGGSDGNGSTTAQQPGPPTTPGANSAPVISGQPATAVIVGIRIHLSTRCFGREQRSTQLHDPKQASLGNVRRRHRSVVRNSNGRARWNLFGNLNQRQRWKGQHFITRFCYSGSAQQAKPIVLRRSLATRCLRSQSARRIAFSQPPPTRMATH